MGVDLMKQCMSRAEISRPLQLCACNKFDSDENDDMCQLSGEGGGAAYRPYGVELISGELTDLCHCHDALLAVKCQLNSRAMICTVNLVAKG